MGVTVTKFALAPFDFLCVYMLCINFTGCLMLNAMEDINLGCGLDSWEMVGQLHLER